MDAIKWDLCIYIDDIEEHLLNALEMSDFYYDIYPNEYPHPDIPTVFVALTPKRYAEIYDHFCDREFSETLHSMFTRAGLKPYGEIEESCFEIGGSIKEVETALIKAGATRWIWNPNAPRNGRP